MRYTIAQNTSESRYPRNREFASPSIPYSSRALTVVLPGSRRTWMRGFPREPGSEVAWTLLVDGGLADYRGQYIISSNVIATGVGFQSTSGSYLIFEGQAIFRSDSMIRFRDKQTNGNTGSSSTDNEGGKISGVRYCVVRDENGMDTVFFDGQLVTQNRNVRYITSGDRLLLCLETEAIFYVAGVEKKRFQWSSSGTEYQACITPHVLLYRKQSNRGTASNMVHWEVYDNDGELIEQNDQVLTSSFVSEIMPHGDYAIVTTQEPGSGWGAGPRHYFVYFDTKIDDISTPNLAPISFHGFRDQLVTSDRTSYVSGVKSTNTGSAIILGGTPMASFYTSQPFIDGERQYFYRAGQCLLTNSMNDTVKINGEWLFVQENSIGDWRAVYRGEYRYNIPDTWMEFGPEVQGAAVIYVDPDVSGGRIIRFQNDVEVRVGNAFSRNIVIISDPIDQFDRPRSYWVVIGDYGIFDFNGKLVYDFGDNLERMLNSQEPIHRVTCLLIFAGYPIRKFDANFNELGRIYDIEMRLDSIEDRIYDLESRLF